MKNVNILFIDDDAQIIDIVGQYLIKTGYAVTTTDQGAKAIRIMREQKFDIVFTDLMMPDINGLEILEHVKKNNPDTEVIIVTGYGSIESAIKALKLGGYDYLQKPINFERMTALIDRITEQHKLKAENLFYKNRLKERYKYDDIVGISSKMQDIYSIIDRISMSSPTVLIQGESGTGKELCAAVIHKNSDRKDKPFVPVNCGALSEGLLESELFGHLKGAFTGAVRDAVGLFKAADGGTIFLDEIAEMPPSVQVKLLRVLQEKKIRPVGDFKETMVDVRVIAATNKNLEKSIKNKTFRKDLFYRLNVIAITMPPLRKIKEDIPFLITHFLKKYDKGTNGEGLRVAQDAMTILMAYDWPGNVRELENIIERAYALRTGDWIEPGDLPPELMQNGGMNKDNHLNLNLRENEINLIKKALKKANGNKNVAAGFLGINLSTVYRKIEKFNISNLDTLD